MGTGDLCWTCGRRVSPEAENCDRCGAMLLALCEECGATESVFAEQCTRCGTGLSPRRYSRQVPWRAILAVTLLLLVGGAVTAFFLLKKDRLDRRWQTLQDASADMAAERYREATVRLRHLLERWPDEHRAHRLLARCYLTLTQLEDARRHAQLALDLAPDRVDPHLVLAVCDYTAGDYEAAAEHARRIVEHSGSLETVRMKAQAHLLLGKIHTKPDRLDLFLAARHLQAAMDTGVIEDPEAWLMLAEISMVYESAGIQLATRGHRELYLTRAQEVARSRLREDPENLDFRFLLARIAYFRGDDQEALRRISLIEDPEPAHRILLAQVLWRLDRQAAAIRELNAVREAVLTPEDRLAVADAFREMGQMEPARAVERTALAEHATDVRLIRREVRQLLAEGNPQAAQALAEQGLVHHPESALLVVSLANALLAQPGLAGTAEERLSEHASGPNSEVDLRLADLLLDTPVDHPRYLERIDRAEALITLQGPAASDRLPVYRSYLEGRLALRRRDLDRAVRILHDLSQRSPADPSVRRLLATTHSLRREFELQARELGSLIELSGDDPALRLERSEAWLRAGFLRDAREDMMKVRAARPRWADAAILLSRIQTIEDDGRTERAADTLREAVDQADDPVRIRISLGLLLARSRDLAGAEEILLEARDRAGTPSEQLEVTDALAQVRAARDGGFRSEASRRVWLDYLDLHPDSLAGCLAFATALIDAGDPESARPWIGRVLARDPHNLSALRLRFEGSLTATPDVEAANGVAEQVHTIAPDSGIDRYLRGRIALLSGNHEEAVDLLADAAGRDPDDPRMAFYLAVACAGVRDFERAASSLDRALELEPRLRSARELLAEVHLDWARALLEAERPSRAAELLGRSLLHQPADFRLRALLAKALYHAGFRENPSLLVRARHLCERMLHDLAELGDEPPGGFVIPTRQLYGAILMAQREWSLAERAFEHHLELSPEDVSSLHALGVCRLRLGQGEDAITPLEKAHALEPGRRETLLVLLDALSALGRHEEAAELVNRRVSVRPDDVVTQTLMAQLLQNRGRTAEAEQVYRDAIRRDPDHTSGADHLVELLVSNGRADEAVEFARDHLRGTTHKADAGVLLGYALEASRSDGSEAEGHLRKALADAAVRDDLYLRALNLLLRLLLRTDRAGEVGPLEIAYDSWLRQRKLALAGTALSPHATHAWYLLGQAWARSGIDTRAEACYRRALGILPDDGRTVNNLAELVGRSAETCAEPRRSDRLVEAHQLAQRALKLLPGQPEPLDTLGVILLRQGHAEAALARFRSAVVAAERNPGATLLVARLLLNVARAQLALDRTVAAKRTLDRALRLAPELSGHPEAVGLASRLR